MTLVDGTEVPLVHFGAILDWAQWEQARERIAHAELGFVVAPHVRYVGEPGEQGTFFVADPSGNVLEFKAFRNQAAVFAAHARDVAA